MSASTGCAGSKKESRLTDHADLISESSAEVELRLQPAPATPVFGVGSRPLRDETGSEDGALHIGSQDTDEARISVSSGTYSLLGHEQGLKNGAQSGGRDRGAKPPLGRRNREGVQAIRIVQSEPSKSCSSSRSKAERILTSKPSARIPVRAVDRALQRQSRFALRWCLTAWQSTVAAQAAARGAETLAEMLDCQDRMDEMAADKVLQQWQECEMLRSELASYADRHLQTDLANAALLAQAQAEATDARLAEAETAQAELAVLRSVRAEVVSERQAERVTLREESAQLRDASSELAELKALVNEAKWPHAPQAWQEVFAEELAASESQSAQLGQERDEWAEHCSALSDELRVQSIMCRRLELDEKNERQLRSEERCAAQQLKDAVHVLEESEMRTSFEELEHAQTRQQLQEDIRQLTISEEAFCQKFLQTDRALTEARLEHNLVQSELETELQSRRSLRPQLVEQKRRDEAASL